MIKSILLNFSESFIEHYPHSYPNCYAAIFNDRAIFYNRESNDQHLYDDAYWQDQNF